MQKKRRFQLHFEFIAIAALFAFLPLEARCQDAATAPTPASTEIAADIKALVASVNRLQSQVETLNSQMTELRNAQQEALRGAEQLRTELSKTREQLAAKTSGNSAPYEARPAPSQVSSTSVPYSSSLSSASAGSPGQAQSPGDSSHGDLQQRVSKLEDDQELMNDKIVEQSQTKVESGSKYRVRLSGLVLLNTAVTRGSVDNLDIPQIAVPPEAPGVAGSFSGSLRQSQIGVETFGPDIAGARTSANVKFDFAGGFPNVPNGAAFGIVRLRTGTVRLDWANTSIVAGQDGIFFAPLTPTTLSSLAIPALSYTGNLWSWTPQVRIEHRFALSENSGIRIQVGILDSLTGDIPPFQSYRSPTVGEESGQPAYATHIGYSQRIFGRDLNVGIGGYYGRQNWGFGRAVDGWAGVTDVSVPLAEFLEFSTEFYRGRAVGGLGGGVGQSILLSGSIYNPNTSIYGLDSTGGWVQLKFKPKPNFEVNFAYGEDVPFASELKRFPASALYYGYSISRNQSPFVNFIYRMRSDALASVEYKRLQTNPLNGNAFIANQVIMSLGYAF
ncbi:MAG TPA: hypothetical protein VH140_06275 [Candidatus Acidoferrum sp.]|nr:hypothetical protein [Candidatus Acidoferrum sp.]